MIKYQKNHNPISLKWFIALAFLSLIIVLVIGYSLLSAHYFVLGMDSILTGNMLKAAQSFVDEVPVERRKGLNHFSGYQISHDWNQMPLEIQRAFKHPPKKPGLLHKHEDSRWFKPPDAIYFFTRCKIKGENLFISLRQTRANTFPLVGRNAAQSLNQLLIISLLIPLTLGGIIWLFFKRISRPVSALGAWARSLDERKLNEAPPDFFYPELNELAGLIQSSLSSVQKSLEREHAFLRHTSHELRTPIGVIRNNIELLRKIQKRSELPLESRQAQVVNRIDRASLTMKYLTETLLWLSRDITEPLPEHPLDLDRLIRQLAMEMRYLLRDKEVDVKLTTEPCVVSLPYAPARIVLGNLLRNAFQHTWNGKVEIFQQQNKVTIINHRSNMDNKDQDLGFGLGLRLTAQLTAKLNWPYLNEDKQDHHRAMVTLKTQTIKKTD